VRASAPNALIEAYSQVSLANHRSFEKLAVVLTQFRARGIDFLLLKGADILPRLYGVWGARSLTDIDLLVREKDLPAVDRVVRELGYLPDIDGNPAYHHPDHSLLLDLVTEIWYEDDTEEIWRRAVQRDLAGLPVRGMGADDLLTYLTVYSVLHRGYFVPSFPKDVALLVRREPLNWGFIVDEAIRRNLKIPLHHGLSYAAGHESIPIPDHVFASLAPTHGSEKALQFVLRKLVTDEAVRDVGHFLLLVSLPAGKSWRRVRQALWPSPTFLRWRYGEESETKPHRTRLFRAVRLSWKSLILLGQILKRFLRR